MRRLGFGLVGVGIIAETYAREISRLEEAQLVAVYGRRESKARSFAEKYGARRSYSDYRRMLEDREVDIVSILTPNGLHKEFAIAAAEAGKQVMVEKPLEVTLERADAIVKACHEHRVKLSVVYQSRFGDAARRVKEALNQGRFGKPLLGSAYDKQFRTPEYYANDYWRGTTQYEGGGSVMTQAIHTIDLLQWFMGPVKTVFAKKRTARHTIEVEDLAVACVAFRNGAFGMIESSTAVPPGFSSRVEVHGENGSAIVSEEGQKLLFWDVGNERESVDAPPDFRFRGISDPRDFVDRHRRPLQDMIDAVKENRDPLVTGEEGRKSLAIVLAMYHSAETGREVELTE